MNGTDDLLVFYYIGGLHSR